MTIKKIFNFLVLILSMFIVGCEDNEVAKDYTAEIIETPVSYNFNSRFIEGESGVSYSESVVHNMIITDLKLLTDYPASEFGNPIFLGNMNQLYDYQDDYNLSSWINTSPSVLEKFYNNISNIESLKDIIDNDVIHGFGETADALLIAWMQKISDNCMDLNNIGTHRIITNQDGLNFSQMIQKTLLGSINYSMGIKYISNLEEYDNISEKSEGDFFTELENTWDKSFGYFGFATDYNTSYIDDLDRINDPYFDSNNDGFIDLKSEYIFDFALITAMRDDGSSDESVNFSKSIFDAYLEGRTLIHNQAPIEEVLAQRDIITQTWERVIAATIVHYINEVNRNMTDLYSLDSTAGPLSEFSVDYNRHWSDMRGYTIALQYNDFKQISDSNLLIIVETMGDTPIHPSDGTIMFSNYQSALVETVKSIFQSTYGFSNVNMEGW